MVHLFAWFLAYAEQMFVSKRRHVLLRWNLSRRRDAREKKNERGKGVPPKRKPKGKRVAYFVTGWSSGIGFETCLSLLQGHKEEEMVVELHLPTRAFPPGGVGNMRKGGDEDANDAGKRLRSAAKSRGLIETGEKEEEEKKKKKNGEKRIKRGEILPCCIASCSFAVFHYSILESVRS